MQALVLFLMVLVIYILPSGGAAQERLQFAFSVREYPVFYLPLLAGEEQGSANSDLVRRLLAGILKAVRFVEAKQAWALERMKERSGFSQEAAKWFFQQFRFTKDGIMSRKAVENVRSFLIEYGIAPQGKVPPVEQLVVGEFTR